MYGVFKKAVRPRFKVLLPAEQYHKDFKITRVVIEIRFTQVTAPIQVKCVAAETVCLLAVL